MSRRVTIIPRRLRVTDGHAHEAVAELRAARHTRVGRLLRRVIGWPVARRSEPAVPLHHPHSHAVPHPEPPSGS